MFSEPDFAQFIAGLGLKHFEPEELLAKTDRAHNTAPPKSLWENIAPTIIVLDRLRERLNRPIRISSAYRSHEYNRRLRGSAPLSQHVAFNAIDFVPGGGVSLFEATRLLQSMSDQWFASPAVFNRSAVSVGGRDIPSSDLLWRGGGGANEFRFRGGVSEYSNFIHIDTRGAIARW